MKLSKLIYQTAALASSTMLVAACIGGYQAGGFDSVLSRILSQLHLRNGQAIQSEASEGGDPGSSESEKKLLPGPKAW